MRKNLKALNTKVRNKVRHIIRSDSRQNVKSREALDVWLKDLKNPPVPKARVLITALRNYTWVEWAAYTAAFIRQWGYESTLLFKDREVESLYKESPSKNFWSGVKNIPGIELVNLNELPFLKEDYQHYFETCEHDAVAALAYDLHLESANILDNLEEYGDKLNNLKEECAKSGGRVKLFLKNRKFDQFICYSGLISDTSTILQAALDESQEVVCVEGWGWRKGHMIYNFNNPSLEYNVRGWMNHFGAWNDKKNKEMAAYFSFLNGQEQNEEWLKNFHYVQQAKLTDEIPAHIREFVADHDKVFLLACNVIGDSSLLNRETIFKSHCEFIEKTVEYFSNHPDLRLIIRAHPAEGWVKGKVVIKMGNFALAASKGMRNILVINDDEKVNTFSLLPHIRVGLVWITSAGVDMVVRGVPVIAAARPKYTGLGIVAEPASQHEFFSLVEEYAKNQTRPTLQQIQQAKEYLYLVFKGFSFEAQGKNFRANTCRLNAMPSQEEHDRFYRILLRLEAAPDRIQ